MPAMRGALSRIALALAMLLPARAAAAWPEALVPSLLRDARRLLPRTLNRLIGEREEAILREAAATPSELIASFNEDLVAGRLRTETVSSLDRYFGEAVGMLRDGRISEGLVRLGASLRVPADLSDPALCAGPQGFRAGVVREYYAFLGRNLEKIPVVLEDRAALGLAHAALPGYWQALLDRGRAQAAVLSRELFVNGRIVDQRSLDYRSPVFAVASTSYSRAVNAIAVTWLVLWREAGGDITRPVTPVEVKPAAAAPPASGERP
jgi:hypothetical protein